MSGIFSVSKSSVTKVKRLVLLVTAFLLTISLVAPILDNGSASAAKLYNTMTLDELGKSSSYYVTLQTCVSNNMYPNITAKSPFYDPVQINWFDDNTATGYVYPEGKTDCKAIMSSALELWNISPADFLKGMKYTQNTPGEYNWTGSGDGAARKNNFVSFVKSGSVTGTSDPADIGGAAAYQRYDYWWDNNCAVQKFGKYDDIKDPVLKTRIDNGVTVEANINSAARTSVTQKYGTVERTDGIKWAYLYNDTTNAAAQSKEPFDFIAYGYHTTPRMVTCQDTAAALTTYADDWVKYLDQKSLRTICENKGFTDTPGSRADDPNPRAGVFALTACISGYDNALSCNINWSCARI